MPALDRKWWTLIAVCTATFMLLLDITVVNVALPDIQSSLHASFSDLQWVVDAYSLTLAAFLLTAGVAGDIYGRRKIFAIGLVVFSLASLVCGLSTTPLMLNLARAVQGVGGAIMFATSLALIAAAFTGRDRGTAFGIYGAVIGGAVAIGPLIGGAITSGIGWRWIFFVNVPIGAVAVLITFTQIAKSEDLRARRIDWVGFVTFSVSLFLLVFALVRGNDFGWGSATTISLLVGAAVLMVGFFVNERFTADPMLDLGLFKIPAFVGLSTVAFCLAASIFAMFLYLTLYIQDNLGYGPLAAGVRFLPMTLLIFFTSFFAGRLTVRMQSRFLLGIGMLFVTGGLLLMATTHPDSTWTVLLPGFLVSGLRGRDRQPGAGLGRRLGRPAAAQRHGLGRQQHLPPGGHRHRHRRARRGVPEPDCGAHHGGAEQVAVRARGVAPRWRPTPGRHVVGRGAPGGGGHPDRRGPQRVAAGVPRRILGDVEPPDGDRCRCRPGGRGLRVRAGAPARLRDPHRRSDRAARCRAARVHPARPAHRVRPRTPSPPCMLEPFTLEGRFVRLEPLTEAHIPALVEAAALDRTNYQWTVTPNGPEQMTAYVHDALANVAAGTHVAFVTVRRGRGGGPNGSDLVVGATRFYDIGFWQWPPGASHQRHGVPDAVDIGYHLAGGTGPAHPGQHRGQAADDDPRLRGLGGPPGRRCRPTCATSGRGPPLSASAASSTGSCGRTGRRPTTPCAPRPASPSWRRSGPR